MENYFNFKFVLIGMYGKVWSKLDVVVLFVLLLLVNLVLNVNDNWKMLILIFRNDFVFF